MQSLHAIFIDSIIIFAAAAAAVCFFHRYPPFFDENPFGIYEKILAGRIEWPKHMDPVAK